MGPERIYQHPLAHLVALEGLALLRSWAGDFDEAFTRARLAEVRRLVNDPALLDHPGVHVLRGSSQDGYRQQATTYDGPNGLFDLDTPFVSGVLDKVASHREGRPGRALDAACGTGRFAHLLAGRGFDVVGVDSSPHMLEVARQRVPTAHFEAGDLVDLPVPDESFDVVVCALALCHAPLLAPVMAEFARVLAPGGHLVISDVHHELVARGSVIQSLGDRGEPGLVPTYRHTPGDYLRAALSVGLSVVACEEPRAGDDDVDAEGEVEVEGEVESGPVAERSPGVDEDSVTAALRQWSDWPWSLLDIVPAEARSAAWDIPMVINWHFRRGGGAPGSA